ncbi:MAG: branched-chain amino acid ABC transporter permease [Hyphomicrobiaceae bacterium]|nr:branched-chain amino acid ABC transporter permease [Hyphomicrobiaceae bacterium]
MTRFNALKTPLIVLALALLILVPADLTGFGIPWGGLKRYGIYILSLWLVTSIAAMGVNLIVGYAGQETLAQAAFLGIGAFTSALLLKAGYPFFVVFLLAGALAFLVGIVLGFPALRVQKHYLAFVTLAFTVFMWLVIRNEDWLTGGVSGMDVKRPVILGVSTKPGLTFYYLILAMTAVLTFALRWILNSPWGRAFTALRENPIRAESLGIDVRTYILLAFAIGSAYGGFAGALYAPLVEFIDPAPFALGPSLLFMLMVVVGGAGSFAGPFIGAAVAVLLPEWLRFAEGLYLIIFSVIVMLMMALCPTGIVGLIERIFTPARRPHADDKGPVLKEAK